MIVNKFIIVLCIIFLILLLRKLSYENFQDGTTTATPQTTSAAPSPVKFSQTIDYNCGEIEDDKVCDFLESVNVCKNTENTDTSNISLVYTSTIFKKTYQKQRHSIFYFFVLHFQPCLGLLFDLVSC